LWDVLCYAPPRPGVPAKPALEPRLAHLPERLEEVDIEDLSVENSDCPQLNTIIEEQLALAAVGHVEGLKASPSAAPHAVRVIFASASPIIELSTESRSLRSDRQSPRVRAMMAAWISDVPE
jgi:hypothetical protein